MQMTVGWWTLDHCKFLEQMAARLDSTPSSVRSVELDFQMSVPFGWEKRLDLQRGQFFYVHLKTGVKSFQHPFGVELTPMELKRKLESSLNCKPSGDLDLNLSLAPRNASASTPSSSDYSLGRRKRGFSTTASLLIKSPVSSSTTSSTSTTSEITYAAGSGSGSGSGRELDSCSSYNSVILTACKSCLMYVIITRADPKCPKCGTAAVVEVSTCEERQLAKRQRLEIDLNKVEEETTLT